MSTIRLAFRSCRPSMAIHRPLSTVPRRLADNTHPNTEAYREDQKKKPLNPHMTNTNSTIGNDMPSVGKDKAPPEFITSISPDFTPRDSIPENTERMTGKTQKGKPGSGPNATIGSLSADGEIGVGEMEGIKFKVEPLKRTGEDANTMRARLLYQSRKRGTLESDLLMSTFADTHLEQMTMAQMQQYDLFLDENDWDIYYWATQEPTPTSSETAEGGSHAATGANSNVAGKDINLGPTDPGKQTGPPELETDEWVKGKVREPAKGEWAQTIGTFKPAYRPVPVRWRNSEILAMLRKHVISRSAGGIQEGNASEEVLAQTGSKTSGGGMAFMPEIRNMDA